jgi:hypothetical protein
MSEVEAAIVKKAQAEHLIVAELRQRLSQISIKGPADGMLAYQRLKRDRPDLFTFRHGATDEWQIVSGWLRKHGVIAPSTA